MLRGTLAPITITILIAGLVGIQFVNASGANLYQGVPILYFISPMNQTVYRSSTIPLSTYLVSANLEYNYSSQTIDYETIEWLNYSLDGAPYPFLNWTLPVYANTAPPITTYANATLTCLSNGVHSLIVYGETTFGANISSEVIFWVYGDAITIPSPLPPPTTMPTPSQVPTSTVAPSASVPEFPLSIALPLVVTSVLVTVLLIRRRKNPRTQPTRC